MPNDPNTPNVDTGGDPAAKAAAEAKFNTEVEARVAAKLADAVKAAQPQVPEKYDLKLPEKASLKAADLDIVAKTAKELGLPQDKAQKYMETLDSHTRSILQAQQSALEQTVDKWGADAAADEELGGKDGSKLEATKAVTDVFLAKFGTPELVKFLSETGLGNHPGLIRAFYRAGKAMKDDVINTGGEGGDGGKGKKTTAEKLYPSMNKAAA